MSAGGFQPSGDATLHAELLWRRSGQPDQTLATADSMGMAGADGGIPGNIDTMLQVGATPAQCGDLLVLRVKMTAGTDGYIEFGATLSVP